MDSEGFAAWRPYARHPDGLSDEHLALLIRAKGQDSLVVPPTVKAAPLGLTLPSALASALGLLAVPAATLAQEPTLADFAAEATGEAERFADLGVAIAEGYRKLGAGLPGHGGALDQTPTLVIRGELDPARPPVLAYALVGSERKLVGFAYTHVLGPR